MGYQGLLFECRSGKGPYLQTLVELLNTPSDEQKKTMNEICGLSEKHPNIMDFAENVTAYQKGPASIQAPIPVPEGPGIASGENLENHLNHLTRGTAITVHAKGGGRFEGIFEEYSSRRLWIRGASKRSFHRDDIQAVEIRP